MRTIKQLVVNNKNFILYIGISFLFLSMIVYSDIFFGEWKLSFSNLSYNFAPFNSLDIKTKGPLLSDVADNFYPIAYYTMHPILFTSWIPSIGIGAPQSMYIYLSILNYIYLLPIDWVPLLLSMYKLFFGLLNMAILMKYFGFKNTSAIISGITFSLSSSMMSWHGWAHSEVSIYAPLLLLFIDRLIRHLKVIDMIGIIIVSYLMLVPGMPTYTAYFMYLFGFYMLYTSIDVYRLMWSKYAILFSMFLCSIIIAALLSLPYTGELITSVGTNGYSESRKSLVYKFLSFNYVKTLFFPYIRTNLTLHFNESTLYTGILSILALPISILYLKDKRIRFFFFSTLILFVLIFTNWLSPIFSLAPLINTSAKIRVIILLNFSLAFLLGSTIEKILFCDKSLITKNLTMLLALISTLIYGVVLFKTIPFGLKSDEDTHQMILTTVIVILTTVLVVFCSWSKLTNTTFFSLFCSILLVVFVCIDMGVFAKNYLPLIPKTAPVIPQATSTVKQLQENTTNNEKIVGLGKWDLYPSTNIYYGLRDIRGHSFVYTNADMMNYYERISSDAYDTSTRIAFKKIDNENLLKYMGVKYIVGEPRLLSETNYATNQLLPVGPINQENIFVQNIYSTFDQLNRINLLIGTSENKFDKNDHLIIELSDTETGNLVRTVSYRLDYLQNNRYNSFEFDAIEDSLDKEYTIKIYTTNIENKGISLYTTKSTSYDGSATVLKANEIMTSQNLAMQIFTKNTSLNTDGLGVKFIGDYNPQIYLAENINIKPDEQSVLEDMSTNFIPNTIYLSQNVNPEIKSKVLENREGIFNVREKRDGNIEFDVNSNYNRIVGINEYNDGNWKVKIDGKKSSVLKVNYLFRGIEISEGSHHVELYYSPKYLKYFFMASVFGLVLLFVLIIKRSTTFTQIK